VRNDVINAGAGAASVAAASDSNRFKKTFPYNATHATLPLRTFWRKKVHKQVSNERNAGSLHKQRSGKTQVSKQISKIKIHIAHMVKLISNALTTKMFIFALWTEIKLNNLWVYLDCLRY